MDEGDHKLLKKPQTPYLACQLALWNWKKQGDLTHLHLLTKCKLSKTMHISKQIGDAILSNFDQSIVV